MTVFGRNHVFTNILIGMGESDQAVIEAIEDFAGKGIIPVLRKVNPHPLREGEMYTESVSSDRL